MKLTEQEEMKLVEEFKKGDMRALRRLKVSLRPLIRSVIKSKLPANSDLEPQIAARIDALLPNLLKKYDPEKSKLNTFLINNISGNVQNAISENQLGAHVPRPEHANLYYYRQAKRQAQLNYGSNPTEEQILSFNKQRLKNVEEVKRLSQYDKQNLIGDIKFGEEGEGFVQFKDQFLNNDSSIREQKADLKLDIIRDMVSKNFNEEEQKIIEEYIVNEKSLINTALTVGVTSSKVRSVINKYKSKAEEALK